MLDYIKNQVNLRMSVNPTKQTKTTEDIDIPNDVITEYAHIFQELDDLTIEGNDAGKARKMAIDIPIEDDDIELETIEFNLGDGRVTDVPGDATVQEHYKDMKTYDMFYQETAETLFRMPRETDSMFDKRVTEEASKKYEAYCEMEALKGCFGFDDINIADKRVPSKLNIDFGPIDEKSDKSFFTKVNTFFATDKDHNINQKQLDSINLVRNGAFANVGKPLITYMESKYDIPEGSSVWDVATPMNLYVPRGNGDSFCVVLEFMNELTNKKEYFGWTRAVRSPKDNGDGIIMSDTDINVAENINMESFITENHYENHDMFIQEEARVSYEDKEMRRRSINRFYQEAIDFGGDGGSDLPPAEGSSDDSAADDSSMDAPADADNDNTDDTDVDTGSSSDAVESDDSSDKEEANVNDVSKDIAEKVSQQTKDETANDTDVTFDDDFDTDTNDSTDTDDTDTSDVDTNDDTSSVDDQLNDLDNSTDDADDMSDSDDDVSDDINNLTIDQLMERGSEKLKGMTLNEIKDFLNSGSEDAIQEAFFLTKKNINKELDIELRKCLGILNDNKMDLTKLLKKFKFAGRGLNRVLIKAMKIREVYSNDEIKEIRKLNEALVDLLVSIKKAKDPNYVSVIKRNIRQFVACSKTVGTFVEKKLKNGLNETVQEAYVQEGLFLSDKNVHKRLASKIPPVHSDLSEIVKANENGKLNKGKLVRMYKPKQYTQTNKYDVSEDYSTSRTTTGEINTVQSENIASLLKILNKILRKPKVQKAFTSQQLRDIEDLCDKLDSFVDFVESILFDDSDKESLIVQVGKDAKELVSLLDIVHNMCCQSMNSTSTRTKKFDNMNDDDSIDDESTTKNEMDDDLSIDDIEVDDTNDDEDKDEEVASVDDDVAEDDEEDDDKKETKNEKEDNEDDKDDEQEDDE